jgi:hypothetical protein
MRFGLPRRPGHGDEEVVAVIRQVLHIMPILVEKTFLASASSGSFSTLDQGAFRAKTNLGLRNKKIYVQSTALL